MTSLRPGARRPPTVSAAPPLPRMQLPELGTRWSHNLGPGPDPGASCPTTCPTDSKLRVGASSCCAGSACYAPGSAALHATSHLLTHLPPPSIHSLHQSHGPATPALHPSPNRQLLCPLPLAPGHPLLSICQFTHPLVTPNMTWALPLTPPNSWLTSPCP